MRYREITEAPIGNYSFHGNQNPGSLRPEDIKAATNPKWVKKLERTFSSVHEIVNVVIVNASNQGLKVDRPQGGDHVVLPSANNLRDWSGCYFPSDFKRIFGFVPIDHENRLNIILVSNEGDERVPLTPWIVAHRFMHALGNQDTSYPRINNQTALIFEQYFSKMRAAMMIIREKAGAFTLAGRQNNDRDKEMFAKLASFSSARNGKIERSGEFIIEIATQYFLKGDFDFDTSSFNLNVSQQEEIDYAIGKAKYYLDKCFEKAKGLLIVF